MIAAFLLGLMGSAHCAGMCGPLVLMTPVVGTTRGSFIASRLIYHGGRLTTYALIGALSGLIGESLMFTGFQRWLSIVVGIAMIGALLVPRIFKISFGRIPPYVKSLFGEFLRKRKYGSIFALGATNGLLPCGLVYMAAMASVSTGHIFKSVLWMLLFGLGTAPMLVGISLLGRGLNLSTRSWMQKLAPVTVAAVALFLILRGDPASLLQVKSGKIQCPACAR